MKKQLVIFLLELQSNSDYTHIENVDESKGN